MIISIANQKGGVGKTVTSINLSAALGREGFATLLMDLDPQGHSTVCYSDNPAEHEELFKVFRGEMPIGEAVVGIKEESIDLVPSGISLAKIERDMISEVDGHFALKDILTTIKDSYDFIILDTPPALGMLTINCLVASDYVLIPVQSSYLSLEGTDDLLETISKVKARFNPELEVLGAVVTIHDRRTVLGKDVVQRIRELFGEKFISTTIGKSVRLEESPAYRESIFRYAPESQSAQEYRDLCTEVLARVKAKGAA